MKRFARWKYRFLLGIHHIKLIDRCLILFMFVLMAQSTYNLFFNEINVNAQSAAPIDSVVRTTSAAIFGYFLSANFIKGCANPNDNNQLDAVSPSDSSAPPAGNDTAPQARIGFNTDVTNGSDSNSLTRGNSSNSSPPAPSCGSQQIIIATVIGLFSLCVILYARNFTVLTANATATITQLRDFVSGCVGFLLGTPSDNHKK